MRTGTSLLLLLLLVSAALLSACPQQAGGTNPQAVVATIGTEPIYALEVQRLVDEEIKRIRNRDGIFARPSPEERAFLQAEALHTLLLNGVYRQAAFRFSKNRAIELTRKATLEKAREVRQALLDGVPTPEVLDRYIHGIYREPAMVNVDLLATAQVQPAYRTEVFGTPVGGVTNIIEDPSGGYYILRIVDKTVLDDGTERVVADSFFVPFDRELGKRLLKEEDLARSKVVISDAALKSMTQLREASRAAGTPAELTHLAEARAALEGNAPLLKQPYAAFLLGWIMELQAKDPSSGATYEAALQQYQAAAELQAKQAPGDPDYGYFLARAGALQERIGQLEAAKETYRAALTEARDNLDLTLVLRESFVQLGDSESLEKAEAEIRRMQTAASYGKIAAGQRVLRSPGRMAEGVSGMDEVFEVEGESRVVE